MLRFGGGRRALRLTWRRLGGPRKRGGCTACAPAPAPVAAAAALCLAFGGDTTLRLIGLSTEGYMRGART